MNREEFITVFNRYFLSRRSQDKDKARGLFCAYCEYQLYKEKHAGEKIHFKGWLEKNNIPDFGYVNPSGSAEK